MPMPELVSASFGFWKPERKLIASAILSLGLNLLQRLVQRTNLMKRLIRFVGVIWRKHFRLQLGHNSLGENCQIALNILRMKSRRMMQISELVAKLATKHFAMPKNRKSSRTSWPS